MISTVIRESDGRISMEIEGKLISDIDYPTALVILDQEYISAIKGITERIEFYESVIKSCIAQEENVLRNLQELRAEIISRHLTMEVSAEETEVI